MASLNKERIVFSESAYVIAPRLRSGCEYQTASDSECRRGARRPHHTAELRDEPGMADAIRHGSYWPTRIERKCRRRRHQGEVTRALSRDEAERTERRRTRILPIAGRRFRRNMNADDNDIRRGRRERGHAKPDARHQRLNRKRISNPKRKHPARTSQADKLSQSEHRHEF
jgi:hypothetical protein